MFPSAQTEGLTRNKKAEFSDLFASVAVGSSPSGASGVHMHFQSEPVDGAVLFQEQRLFEHIISSVTLHPIAALGKCRLPLLMGMERAYVTDYLTGA